MYILTNKSPLSALGILVISATLLSCTGGAEERQEKYLLKAESYFAEKNFVKTAVEARNVLQINPKNAKARYLLGEVALSDGEPKEAYSHFMAAIEFDPNYVEPHVQVGMLHMITKNNELAMESMQIALDMEPSHKRARNFMAALQVATENPSRGRKIAEGVLSEFPGDADAISVLAPLYFEESPEKALNLIDSGLLSDPKNVKLKRTKIGIYTKLKNEEQIEQLYLELIAENPDRGDFVNVVAVVYESQGRIEESEDVLRTFIGHSSGNLDAIFKLVGMLGRQYGPEKSIDAISEYIESYPDVYELKQALAEMYLSQKESANAESVFRTIIRADEQSVSSLKARAAIARIKLSEGKMGEVDSLLAEILKIEPNNAQALVIRARIKLSEDKITEGISDLRAALKNDDKSIEALTLLAIAQEKDGSPSLALDNYNKIVQIDDRNVVALMAIAKINLLQNNLKVAKAMLNRLLMLEPSHGLAAKTLTQIYVSEKDWDAATKVAKTLQVAKGENSKVEGLTLEAGVLRARGEWGGASDRYSRALSLAPQAFEPLAGVVDSYLIKKDYEGAIELLKGHKQKHPKLHVIDTLLAHVHSVSGDLDRAVDGYKTLIKEQPDNQNNYQKLAAIYYRQGHKDKMEQVYKQGIKRHQDFFGLKILLGNYYESESRHEEAVKEYENVLLQKPNLAVAKNNLANLLINNFPSEENFKRALELVAGFSDSQSANFLDTLGWAHLHMNNVRQAISYLEAAIEIRKNPEFYYHLGVAYKKSGDIQKAKEYLGLATDSIGAVKPSWLSSAQQLAAGL